MRTLCSPKHSRPRLAAAGVVIVSLFALLATSSPTRAGSAPPLTVPPSEVKGDVGDIVVVGEEGRPIQNGDGSTRFFVRVPDGAACPGDSANDQWRVNSFLIPIDEDPLDLLFGPAGPEPAWEADRYPLFTQEGNLPVVFNMLQRNPSAGSPGAVNAVAQLTFTMLAQNPFKSGRYRMGIACTYFAQTTQYWDIEVDITAATDGKDSQLRWTLPDIPAPPTTPSDSGSSAWVWILMASVGAGALLLLAIVRVRTAGPRRQTRSRNESLRQQS